ncbi:hypothetical protein HMPREF3033_01447 [Veillonellaceae bacterium DNF00751]|nr:hypothetical protein HMPREF3033_01447 [Veillonellaceae bacterium DNF00751]
MKSLKTRLMHGLYQKNLLKDLYKEQEKFKYLKPDVEDIIYFLEEYKPKSADPNITCF